MTTYYLAERGADNHLSVYATTHQKPVADRLLAAFHAAGHADMEIVPVGRQATFAERYAEAAA